MSTFTVLRLETIWLSVCVIALASGCGGNSESGTTAASEDGEPPADGTKAGAADDASPSLPTASIGGETASGTDTESRPTREPNGPRPGTPAWYLHEIQQLRRAPLPRTKKPQAIAAEQKHRNERTIELATKAIGLTHADESQVQPFTAAVRYLVEARLQLALLGHAEHVEDLYADATALYERDPQSMAAAEAAFAVTRFAHTNARRFGKQEPQWLEEFAKQARVFATNFPGEGLRAVTLLHAAAWSCELHGLLEEAKACHVLLSEEFPDTPQGRQSVGALRRLSLEGESVRLAGPTLDGGFFSIDKWRGKAIVVVFFNASTKRFVDEVERWNDLHTRYARHGLRVVGVSFDEDEAELRAFLKEHDIEWPIVFHGREEEAGWSNPLAEYYGIRELPVVWLVNSRGIAEETELTVDGADSAVRRVLSAR